MFRVSSVVPYCYALLQTAHFPSTKRSVSETLEIVPFFFKSNGRT